MLRCFVLSGVYVSDVLLCFLCQFYEELKGGLCCVEFVFLMSMCFYMLCYFMSFCVSYVSHMNS